MFASGVISADDEVAVAHGDASTNWTALNDTLVDCQILLAAAADAGVVSADEANAVLVDLQSVFYPHRRLRESARRVLGVEAGDRLAAAAHTSLRPKQSDALQALTLAATPASTPPAPEFVETSAWGLVLRTEATWPER